MMYMEMMYCVQLIVESKALSLLCQPMIKGGNMAMCKTMFLPLESVAHAEIC